MSILRGKAARIIAQLALSLLATFSILALLVALLNVVGCCAIDCERFPEQCRANEQRQANAALAAMAAFVVTAASIGGVVALRRRG